MKPTAVRANKTDLNSTLNNTSSVPSSKPVCSPPNKNQSHNASPASANSTQLNVLNALNTSGTTTVPSSSASITTSTSSISIVSSQSQLSAARDENHSHAIKTVLTRDQQPLQNSIIPTTAPVAFAAVAKHSTSQHTANEGNIFFEFKLFNFNFCLFFAYFAHFLLISLY